MPSRNVLIADDDPDKLQMMKSIVQAAVPSATLHISTSARQALAMSASLGPQIDVGVIDFDFPGEGLNGADVIGDLRSRAPRARIACATSRRPGGMFDEASAWTIAAGADHALCSHAQNFEHDLRAVVAEGMSV